MTKHPKFDQLDQLDLLWGAAEIGAALGVSDRKVFHYLENGWITGARRVGKRWVISRKALVRQFVPADQEIHAA